MNNFDLIRELSIESPSKILMVVADGLGGLPGPEGLSELEMAKTPNLDQLAAESVCGVTQPVLPGITPGSGPGHLALFGYDPLSLRHWPRRAGRFGHRFRAESERPLGAGQLLHGGRQGRDHRPPRRPHGHRPERGAVQHPAGDQDRWRRGLL